MKNACDYHLRCTLCDVHLEVIRHVRVPGNFTLSQLHLVLQNLMQWENRHLHLFVVDGVAYSERPDDGGQDEEMPLEEVLVGRPEVDYRYDFGDSWEVRIEVLRTYSTSRGYPVFLAGVGPAPPEDCGGPPGFEYLLDILEDPTLPDPDGLRRWVPRGYDHRGCPFDRILRDLQKVFGPHPRPRALGGYDLSGLNLKQAMVAALLDAGEPHALSDLAERLEAAGVMLAEGQTSLKKAWRRQLPLVATEDGRVDLDRDCPQYLTLRRAMKPHRLDQDAKRFLVKRFPLRSATVAGEPIDVVLVVEEFGGWVAASRVGPRGHKPELALDAIEEAMERRGRPGGLVVDDRPLQRLLEKRLELPVEYRRALPELEHPYLSLESAMAGSRASFAGVPSEVLKEFIIQATGFALEAPWLSIDDEQMILVEGLTPEALILTVLGGAGQTYGLGVFDDLAQAAAMMLERPEARPAFFLSYLEGAEAFPLLEELTELGLGVVDEQVVPFCFEARGAGGTRSYRLLTDLISVVLGMVAEGSPRPGRHGLSFADGRRVQTVWPVNPVELADTVLRWGQSRPGRNEPCWCGSGKKYKHCHWRKD